MLPTPNACVYGHWCHASMFRRRCKAAYTMHWNDILGLRQGCRAVSVRARTLGGSGTAVAGLFCCFRAALAISNGRVRCMVNRRYYVSNAHSQRCRFAPRRGDSTSSLCGPCMRRPACGRARYYTPRPSRPRARTRDAGGSGIAGVLASAAEGSSRQRTAGGRHWAGSRPRPMEVGGKVRSAGVGGRGGSAPTRQEARKRGCLWDQAGSSSQHDRVSCPRQPATVEHRLVRWPFSTRATALCEMRRR